MIGGLTIYEIVWFFMLYSFLGWVLEVVYHAVSNGEIVNRGFLNGPVCPIYGFGMVGVFTLFNSLASGGITEVNAGRNVLSKHSLRGRCFLTRKPLSC